MGRCRNCHVHFWGNPHFCPGCKADLWYEEYSGENWNFKTLQEEGNRLIAKGNYKKAAVVLKIALDLVMYRHAQHSMHRLKDAVGDFVWLYSNEAADISDDRITDVLDYFEEECFGQPDKYHEELMQLRRQASKRLPQAQYREKKGLDFPHLRTYWMLAPVSRIMDQNSLSGYEPDILEAKHLLLTESFLYLYLNFSRVMKYLQVQDSLNTRMIYDELLPLLHPDLDMEKNGENDTAKLMGQVLCSFLEDGFEEFATLYMDHFTEEAAEKVIERCGQITGEDGVSSALLGMAVLAPLLSDGRNGQQVYEAAVPCITAVLTEINRLHQVLSETLDEKERQSIRHTISVLCAEYCAVYGAGEYRMGLEAQADPELFLDAMDQAAGNGITMAAEEMMRSYFYGHHGCEIQPGYAKFYSRLVSLRHVASSISEAVESVEGLEMIVPGDDSSL